MFTIVLNVLLAVVAAFLLICVIVVNDPRHGTNFTAAFAVVVALIIALNT